jgi:hypothetical protein
MVEDDQNFNNVLADFARSKNFEVWQAFTGTDGWELIKKHKPGCRAAGYSVARHKWLGYTENDARRQQAQADTGTRNVGL